jgi:transcriptional regulator with XRE-family HTH domain
MITHGGSMNKSMKFARLEAGLTQQELARMACVSESTVTRVETGRSRNREVCNRLAAVLKRDVLEMFPDIQKSHDRRGL